MRRFVEHLPMVILGLTSSAAAAQYYPGYGPPTSYPGPGAPRPGLPFGYGPSRQVDINQCASGAQARLDAAGGGRVLGISDARPAPDGGMSVRGVATSAPAYGYGYGYTVAPSATLTWRCRTDFRGFIRDLAIDPLTGTYDYNSAPWTNDYSQFGYRRY